jgi:hypothetical protein
MPMRYDGAEKIQSTKAHARKRAVSAVTGIVIWHDNAVRMTAPSAATNVWGD